jgi:hypothetical protein
MDAYKEAKKACKQLSAESRANTRRLRKEVEGATIAII